MRWLALTFVLLAASATVMVGIYLRDRDSSVWLPPERAAATLDVRTMLLEMHCPAAQCTYQFLGRPRPNHWVARINNGATARCFDIDLLAFDVSEAHGLSGVVLVGCETRGVGSGA